MGYPSGVQSFTTKQDGPGNTIQSAHVNDLQTEVVAVETGLLGTMSHAVKTSASFNTSSTNSTSITTAGGVTASSNFYGLGATLTSTTATAVTVAGGVTANGVGVIGKDGRIPAISGTYFADLSGANITGITGGMTLLHTGSGTDTTVGATNVDTYALASQLTDKDTLYISMTLRNTGNAGAIVTTIINSTDTATLQTPSAVNNAYRLCEFWTRCVVGSPTLVSSLGLGAAFIAPVAVTFTTNFTGAWTIALRHAGITAPDTLVWSWSIYKIAGQ